MSLNSLEINQFRNLHHVKLQPDAGLNIISGENAAGKTSLLEAIFYLSYGRSFRSSQTRDLIQHEQDYFQIIAKADQNSSATIIGIQKSTKDQIIRVNQQDISKISVLSALLPVIALHPDSHHLISGGPEQRRQYLDWGVFHVEHGFIDAWKNFKKALSQRNAALRHNQTDKLCQLWDQSLAENAELIESYRNKYLSQLNKILQTKAEILFQGSEIVLSYKRGWGDDEDYLSYLTKTIKKDKEKGFTQAGPHRADLRIKLDGKSAQTSISRGQQKKLVVLLKLAQLELFLQTSDKKCLLLFDDLPAELDEDNRQVIMTMLSHMNVQLFITAIDLNQLDLTAWKSCKMFHVEHGSIAEINA